MSLRQRVRGTIALTVGLVMIAVTTPDGGARAETITVSFESTVARDVALGSGFWLGNAGFTTQDVSFSGRNYGGFVASRSTVLSGWGYFWLANSPREAEISAYANLPAGGGFGGSQRFAVASGTSSTIDLPVNASVQSVRATNTATGFFSLRDGDQFAKPFGKVFDENSGEDGGWVEGNVPDWFKVTFTGFSGAGRTGSITGQVEFFLADYRFESPAADYIVQDWTLIDLAPLGSARSIGLGFTSSDVGTWGMNTPTYVAIDDLTFAVVPEPPAWALVAGGLVTLAAAARRRRVRMPRG